MTMENNIKEKQSILRIDLKRMNEKIERFEKILQKGGMFEPWRFRNEAMTTQNRIVALEKEIKSLNKIIKEFGV